MIFKKVFLRFIYCTKIEFCKFLQIDLCGNNNGI